jgi:hypothetical protein
MDRGHVNMSLIPPERNKCNTRAGESPRGTQPVRATPATRVPLPTRHRRRRKKPNPEPSRRQERGLSRPRRLRTPTLAARRSDSRECRGPRRAMAPAFYPRPVVDRVSTKKPERRESSSCSPSSPPITIAAPATSRKNGTTSQTDTASPRATPKQPRTQVKRTPQKKLFPSTSPPTTTHHHPKLFSASAARRRLTQIRMSA